MRGTQPLKIYWLEEIFEKIYKKEGYFSIILTGAST